TGIFRPQLAQPAEGLRLHSQRHRPPLFAELLSATQSQSRLAHHHHEAGWTCGEKIPSAYSQWLSAKTAARIRRTRSSAISTRLWRSKGCWRNRDGALHVLSDSCSPSFADDGFTLDAPGAKTVHK